MFMYTTRRTFHFLATLFVTMVMVLSGAAILVSTDADAATRSCHKAYTVSGHWVAAHTAHSSKGKVYTVKRHYVRSYTVKSNCPATAGYSDGYTDGWANEAVTHEVPPTSPGTGRSATVVAYNKGWIAGEQAYRAQH